MSEQSFTSRNSGFAAPSSTPPEISETGYGPRTLSFSDYIGILTEQFGERFRVYRTEYQQSLRYDKNGYLPRFPLSVTLELVNRCNLECVMCFTINHDEKKSTLSLDKIKNVFNQCSRQGLPALVIGLGSEPLLSKHCRGVLAAAREAEIMDIFLGTNGILLTEDLVNFLIDQKIARIEISVDAATRETYRKVRQKDVYDRLISNINMLLAVKKRRKSALPIVRLCFCVQDLNRHEQADFEEMWREKVDYIDFQQLSDFSNVEELRRTGTTVDIDDVIVENSYCAYPFNSLNVWADGTVTPCCSFFAKSDYLNLGNIADSSLEEIWNGEPIRKIRRQIISGDLNPSCKVCLGTRDKKR